MAMSAASWKRGTDGMLENLKRMGYNLRIIKSWHNVGIYRYRLVKVLPDGGEGGIPWISESVDNRGPSLTKDQMFYFLQGVEEMSNISALALMGDE